MDDKHVQIPAVVHHNPWSGRDCEKMSSPRRLKPEAGLENFINIFAVSNSSDL
jgi:hypothetical protein